MGEEHGIKETKEVVVGVMELAAVMTKLLRDGFQPGADAMGLFAAWQTNPEFKAALVAAADNVGKVPDEVKDLDGLEGVELGVEGLIGVRKILVALKKEA